MLSSNLFLLNNIRLGHSNHPIVPDDCTLVCNLRACLDVEPISLIFIAPLFHSCLEHLQLFKNAESSALEAQVLLFQLECHHENLVILGKKHGFFNATQTQVPILREIPSRVELALRLLETLFKDSKGLDDRYGVVVSDDAIGPERTDFDVTFPNSAGLHHLNWRRTEKKDTY